MARVILLVLDSLGIGNAPDADRFSDKGADTFGHIAKFCTDRGNPLKIPNLSAMGLPHAHALSTGEEMLPLPDTLIGAYGCAIEQSNGKDTPSGHWEIAGVPVRFDWGYFPEKIHSFPQRILDKIVQQTGIPGYIGNCHASGTEIIARLGEKHIATGKPIFYTSADSVFQIACHEETFGLNNLYTLCQLVREVLDEEANTISPIGRVIARPFVGKNASNFKRTHNRHDYSVLPPSPTLLVRLMEAGREVIAIGKMTDIYAAQGITKTIKAGGNPDLIDATLTEIKTAPEGSLLLTNLVDFDMEYGHRRDVTGYAAALEYLDTRLPEMTSAMKDDDWLILTADHGCDPTWTGTDHTREKVPVLVYNKLFYKKLHNNRASSACLGVRETFADIGQSIADILGINPLNDGQSFYSHLKNTH